MKAKIKSKANERYNIEIEKLRIETENFIFDFDICPITNRLIINKVDGEKESAIAVYPRYTNEIEII
jgi:hypothetical protein